MEKKIKKLLAELKDENYNRAKTMKSKRLILSTDEHALLRHKYNNTLDIIKRLENLTNDQ